MAKELPARAPAFTGESDDRPRLVRLTTLKHMRLTLVADVVEAVLEHDNGGVIVVTATDAYGVLGDFKMVEQSIWPEGN